MSAITVANPLPATIVCLSIEAIDRIDGLVLKAVDLSQKLPADEREFALMNDLYKALHACGKELEASRTAVKQPVITLGRAIDEAAKSYAENIDQAKQRLGAKIKAFQDAVNARLAAERKAAEEEATRLQAELNAKAEFERLPDAPILDVPNVPIVQPAYVAPPLRAAVKTVTTEVLVIDNISLIPRSHAGINLLVPDERAIKQLLKAGVALMGCHLEKRESIGATGRI